MSFKAINSHITDTLSKTSNVGCLVGKDGIIASIIYVHIIQVCIASLRISSS